MVFWAVVALSFLAWLGGIIPFVLALLLIVGIWALVSWRNRHESQLLARTFELALEGKDRAFQEYMWRHLDRRMLSEGL
jgi:high-affinity Fe2+/Pb2+ permease